MNKNRKRVTKNSKKASSPTKPAIISAQPLQITTPPKGRFHINLAEINLWQSVILFSAPLLFITIVLFPILNGLHHLHPEATIIADPIVTFIGFVLTVIATGIFSIKEINPFHPKKYKAKQAFYAATSGTLLSILLLVWAIPWPVPQSVSASLSTIPFPPYKGVLVLDTMQSKPTSSSKYFWEQRSDGQQSCKIEGSTYYVTSTKQENLELCEALNSNFHNFAYEIAMSFVKPGTAIIFFRLTPQVSYQLAIQSSDNYADLSLSAFSFDTNEKISQVELIKPIFVVDRYQGPISFGSGYTNHIGIVANNQNLNIYVNGETTKAWQITDDSASQGAIGVGAFTPLSQDSTQTEVAFSNARIWQL